MPSVIKKNRVRTVKKNNKLEKCEWTTLVKNDLIKCVSGGPYWLNENNEKICMGYVGIFKVLQITIDGILAYPIKASESGICFLYMGMQKIMPSGTIMKAHHIKRIIKNE